MKCNENGGCPFKAVDTGSTYHEHIVCCTYFHCKAPHSDCHFTPDLFPLTRATLAGEWSCETCRWPFLNFCKFVAMRPIYPCIQWQSRGGYGDTLGGRDVGTKSP